MRKDEVRGSFVLQGNGHCDGSVEGEAIISSKPFGFFLGMDPETGTIIDKRHDLYGGSIRGKVFIYPYGRGSTGTPGIFMQAVKNRTAPAAIVNLQSEPMIIACALLVEEFFGMQIPVVDGIEESALCAIRNGDNVRVDGATGMVQVLPVTLPDPNECVQMQ